MRILAISLFLISGSIAAQAAWDADLLKARDLQDLATLQKMSAELQGVAEKAAGNAEAQYKAALAYSYLGEVSLEKKDKPGAEKAAEAGIRAAEKAVSLQPKNAENYRVLATLCGQAIPAVSIMNAIGYGKRAKEAITKAMELDPKSARVFEAEGVGNYYLPPAFGGGPELAIKDFKKAIELNPKLADSYLWLGLAQRKLKHNGEARQSFQKAIDLDPQRIWLKEQLEKTPAQ